MSRPPLGSYTMITDLPALDSPAPTPQPVPTTAFGQRQLPPGTFLEPRDEPTPENLARKIRKTGRPLPESGMTSNNPLPPQAYEPHFDLEQQQSAPVRNPLYDINCLEVSQHVKNCPVCSEIYKCDRSLHNFIIFVLVVVSLLLFKGMLDAQAKCASN